MENLKSLAARVCVQHHSDDFRSLKVAHHLKYYEVCQEHGFCKNYKVAVKKSHFKCIPERQCQMAFIFAVTYGHFPTVKWLIEKSKIKPDYMYEYCIRKSFFSQFTKIFKFLQEHNKDYQAPEKPKSNGSIVHEIVKQFMITHF